MEKSLVSVIIAHQRNTANLTACLRSLQRQDYGKREVLLVDNTAPDSLSAEIKAAFPEVTVISPGSNILYTRAHNLGLARAEGEFVLFLNDDVVLADDFLGQLVEALGRGERIGMACGKILRPDKKTIDMAGQFLGRDRRPVERGWKEIDRGQYDFFCHLFSPGGVAPMYRRQVLRDVSLAGECFDGDFRIFYEDLDLAWRAQRFGWRCLFTPLALAWHERGASTQTLPCRSKILSRFYFTGLSDELKWHLVKNRYAVIIKNDRLWNYLLNLPFILLYEAKLWLYIVVFKPKLLFKFMAGAGFFIKMFKKRAAVSKKIKEKKNAQGAFYNR